MSRPQPALRQRRLLRGQSHRAVGAVLGVAIAALAFVGPAGGTEPADTYWSAVSADAPVAQYRLIDAAEASTLADSAGSDTATNTGITLGGAGPFPGSKAGEFGVEAYATLASDPLEGASEFTAEAWVDWSGGSSYGQPIFDFGGGATDHMYLTPASSLSEHEMAFVIQTSAETSAQVTAPELKSDGWHFLAVSETSSGTLTLYLDGKQVGHVTGQTLSPSSLGSVTDSYLGKSLAGAPDFQGSLSNVAFYAKALSVARIEAQYDAGEFPVDATAPTISGSAEDEAELTAHAEDWTGVAPIEFGYQWLRCDAAGESCSEIGGAGEPHYLIGHEDVEHTLRVEVTGTNAAGKGAAATSAKTAMIAARKPSNTAPPIITGTPEDGQTLSVGTGSWSGTPPLSFAYQWRRCDGAGESCVDISGATSSTYAASFEEVGHSLRVRVTATNAGGSSEASTSASAFVAPTPLTELGYTSEFGKEGSGDGQFKEPWAVAVGAAGAIFVLDRGNDRIEKFSEAGGYLGQFGTEGSGDGQLNSPAGIAVDGKGHVWVADTGNQRLEEFDEHGEFVRTAGEGLIGYAEGIAVDRAGHVWASATSDGHLAVFGEDGEHLKDVGTHGSEPGQLGEPEGLTVDAAGHVWVADNSNERVEEYDETGEYLSQFGVHGDGAGQIDGPYAIAAGDGHVLLAEFANDRVQEFDEEGAFIAQLGVPGSEAGQLSFPTGLAVDPAHGLLIADAANNRIQRLSPEAPGAPVSLAPPSISGLPGVGSTLAARTGAWRGSPRRGYSYQWQRCDEHGEGCTNIEGATALTYTVLGTDLGSTLRVVVTATNTLGSASSTSAATEPIGLPPVNTSLPTISGTPQETVQLMAEPGTWEGSSGVGGYQWQRCDEHGEGCTNIEGAYEERYRPTAADLGHTLRVTVLEWNSDGETAATSLASSTVLPSEPPVNISPPTISGTAQEGKALITSTGTWEGTEPISFGYEWQRCNALGEECSDVEADGSSETYTPTQADVGHTLRVIVHASSRGEATASSLPTGEVLPAKVPEGGESPQITGVEQDGQTLTASVGTWRPPGSLTYAYQWERCSAPRECASIEGAISSSYLLGEDDIAKTIRVTVTATNPLGSSSASSEETKAVLPITPPANTEAPTITGTPESAHTLTAHKGEWRTPHPPLTYAYQWQRCNYAEEGCTDIVGATAAAYTVGAEDTGGHRLRIVVRATDSLGISANAEDSRYVIASSTGIKTYSYDANGNLESQTDGNGHTTKHEYGPDNEQTKVTKADGSTAETGYDANGQVISQTDGDGHTTKYKRNVLGEVTEVIDPLSRTTKKEYDAAGNLTSLTDSSGRTTTYHYDAARRLTKQTYSDGTTPDVEYEYDADGNRIKMVDGTGTSTYHYDELNRLTEATNGHGDSTAYEYDLAGNQTKITYPSGKSVERSFDADRRLQSVKDWLGNTTSFAYDPDSNLTSITFPEGTDETDRYGYDFADQMTEAAFGKGSETLASLAYGRAGNEQVASSTSGDLPGEESTAYSYDAANRLTKAGSTAYEYDDAGGPTKLGLSSAGYDEADQLEHAGSTSYSFNEEGQRTKATPSSGPATTYGYDQAGDLTSVDRASEGETPAIEKSYTYDGEGLRAGTTSGGTTKHFTWDQTEELPLILSDGSYSFIYGPADTPIEQVDSEGHATYLHHDQQGSIRMLSNKEGSVQGKRTYDAYGNMVEHTGSATSPLGYDGQYTDADTGLIYLRARSYDPGTGEFLSVDPLETVTGEPYIYVGDDPLDQSDPSGRCGVLCWGGIALGTVALATGVGEALGLSVAVGEAEISLGTVSWTTGLAAAGVDAKSCVSGNDAACVAAGVGAIASGAGIVIAAVATETAANGARAIAIPAGGLSLLTDVVDALAASTTAKASCE